ncbi:hypothetical protein [Streptacidiphilus cavernicola]|uniref:Uncharacterized protein n=1 Tax=Streptacidiphilus cavernicola TaxID=3342716 RepID=A0ABV6V119_9ACTN
MSLPLHVAHAAHTLLAGAVSNPAPADPTNGSKGTTEVVGVVSSW